MRRYINAVGQYFQGLAVRSIIAVIAIAALVITVASLLFLLPYWIITGRRA